MYRVILSSIIIYFCATTVLAEAATTPRVCIIGAGYSGLATARYMKNNGLNFTVFESTNFIGGTWRFDPRVGNDEFGVPLYTNQYKHLRINAPVQTMEFNGYIFPEDTVSFPSGACVYKYMQSFAKYFDLLKDIQLRRQVTWVQWTGDNWNLTYMKSDTKENVTEQCDFVVVGSGIFNKPYIPKFEGQDSYTGKVMHSHEYKDAEDYRDQRVLIIGGSGSGMDLALHLHNITSKLVHSHHIDRLAAYNQPNYSKTFIRKPDVRHFTLNGAVFEDGSSEEFDLVIYCTGFKFSYPFLNHLSSGVTTSDNYVFPLYQHIVNINQPTMAFLGATKVPFAKLLDIQAEYIAALAARRFELPSREEMLRKWAHDVPAIIQDGYKANYANSLFNNVDKYFDILHKEAGVQWVPPVFKILLDFDLKHMLEDFSTFRDYDFKIKSDTQYEKKYNPRKEVCPFEP